MHLERALSSQPLAPRDAPPAAAALATPVSSIPSRASFPPCEERLGELLAGLISALSTADRRFEHVSITHPHRDPTGPVVATSALATTMAVEQLRTDAGAQPEAVRTGLPVITTAADRRRRFPAIHSTASALQVDLQLAVPLLRGARAVGALSVYTTGGVEVDLSLLELAEALAAQAAVVIEQDLLIQNLQTGLQTRQQIGTAIGILMSRYRVTDEQAFALLRKASQDMNRKLRNVADDVTFSGELPLRPDGEEAQNVPR